MGQSRRSINQLAGKKKSRQSASAPLSHQPPADYRINLKIAPPFRHHLQQAPLRAAAEAVLRFAAPATCPGELTILITGETELRRLNRAHRQLDRATDVLAFPCGECDPDSDRYYWGDVVISYPRARRQAHAAGHSIQAEVQLLIVHGILHLLGYDHATAQQTNQMWTAQAAILAIIEQ